MIYTLTLNPAIDYDIYLDKLEAGELNLSKEVVFRPGGKGINVSIMLKNLAMENVALGFASKGFTGSYLVSELSNMGIKNDFVLTEGITRINVKINDKEDETEIAGISPDISEKSFEILENMVKNLKNEDILVMSGSIPQSLAKNIYFKLANMTKAKTVLDTRGSSLLDNICNNILVKPNIKELEQVFNVSLKTDKDIYEYASKLIDRGVENVLVSMGKDGAVLVKKGKYLKANIPAGKYINSIGAGDSTVAGFVYGYVNGYEDKEILRLAVACGSSTAYSYGIGEKALIDELLNNIQIEEAVL